VPQLTMPFRSGPTYIALQRTHRCHQSRKAGICRQRPIVDTEQTCRFDSRRQGCVDAKEAHCC
jgi:hypothetical protein